MEKLDQTTTATVQGVACTDNEKRWAREFASEGVEVVSGSPSPKGRAVVMTATTGEFLILVASQK